MQSRVDLLKLYKIEKAFRLRGAFFCCLRQGASHGLHGLTLIDFFTAFGREGPRMARITRMSHGLHGCSRIILCALCVNLCVLRVLKEFEVITNPDCLRQGGGHELHESHERGHGLHGCSRIILCALCVNLRVLRVLKEFEVITNPDCLRQRGGHGLHGLALICYRGQNECLMI